MLFGSNGNSYAVCAQSDVLHVFTHYTQHRNVCRAKEIKQGQQWMLRAEEILLRAILLYSARQLCLGQKVR